MKKKADKFRLHPLTLVYPKVVEKKRCFVIETYSYLPPLIIEDSRVMWAISVLPLEFTKNEALTIWLSNKRVKPIANDFWDIMIREKIVLTNNEEIIVAFDDWKCYNWQEAFIYNEATKDYPFLQMDLKSASEVDQKQMAEYIDSQEPPSIYTEFNAKFKIQLDKIIDFNEYYKSNCKPGILNLQSLNFIFDLCFGVRGFLDFSIQGKFLKKSIPSGGARHPLEIFYISFEAFIIPNGIYHYNLKSNTLDCIKSGSFYNEFEKFTYDLFKKYENKPKGLIIFSAKVERAMWRYRDDRSYRAILIDIGHAVMQLRIITKRLSIEGYSYQKFMDSNICNTIGIDEKFYLPLYTATLI